MSYVHLHLHTDYSILDGLGKIKDYVRRAKELGMDAIAITDHGVGYGLDDFYDECKAGGIKPILGCEFYVAPADRKLKETVDGESYYHLILLVKNETGYRNLCKLITRSNTEGFYKKPRIDFSLLRQFHDGLICTSACVAGEVSKKILKGDVEGAEETALKYRDLFGDDYYLEIQKHGIMDEAKAFQIIIQIARKYDIPLICTNDCHYVYPEDKEAHDWLLCMQTKSNLDDPERLHYEGDYSLRSEEEMRSLFPNLPDAFDNTVKIADKCNFDFTYAHKPSDYRMPKVFIPPEYGKDYFQYMSDEAYKGLDWRYPEGHPERQQAETQLEYELGIIKQMGFAEYFLDTRKTIMWAKSHDVLVGPGRGSGAGSVNNYCLGITDIDPIKYHLIFERFLNPERISMPDIDVDYEYDRKDDVIKSEADSNGLDHFSKIQTFTAMLPKGAIKACIRVAGLPPKIGDHFSKMIPDDAKSLEEAMQLNPDLKEEIEGNEDYRKIWNIATKIQGTKSAVSTHACGHIPTPVPCEDLYPCSVDKKTGYLVCQYNMAEVEHLGNLKKDLLMLRNLTVISYARNELKKRGIDVPLWNEDILNDKETHAMLSRGETMGVFQLEGAGITQFIKELRPDSFEDIIAGVSLYRPGPMDFIPQYVQGKHHPETIHYLVPQLEHILKPTYGVIVYQEQVMQIVRDLAGFSMGRADVVRKAMG